MTIIIICGCAPPEPGTAARVHWDMANYLVRKGHSVWFISPRPSRPLGENYPQQKETTISRIHGNFCHVRVKSFTYPDYNVFLRALESADFGIRAIRFINRKIKHYDLIYASPWAFLGHFFILMLRKNKKKPVVMNVQDLYPESFLCKMKSGFCQWLFSPLYFIDRFNARRADHISVISENMKQVYMDSRKVPEPRISILENWQDESVFIQARGSMETILKKYSLEELKGRFVYMYLGNIGPVAGVENVISGFAGMKSHNTSLVIAGSGSYRLKCLMLARQLNVQHVHFIEVPPGLEPVAELQSISDILMLPIHPEASGSSIPSKLIAYMFSSRPVISSAKPESETGRVIQAAGCGWLTRSNDVREWSDNMQRARETDLETRKLMGEAGFQYAMKNYSRKAGLNHFNTLLTRILNKSEKEAFMTPEEDILSDAAL